MHQVEARLRIVVGWAIEDAEALRGVRGVQVDEVFADGGVEVGEGEREAPGAFFAGVRHGRAPGVSWGLRIADSSARALYAAQATIEAPSR